MHRVGDVMYDAALLYGEKAERHSDVLTRLGLSPKGYVLATIHRADNTDSPERLRVIVGFDLFAYGDGRAGNIIADVLIGLYMDS